MTLTPKKILLCLLPLFWMTANLMAQAIPDVTPTASSPLKAAVHSGSMLDCLDLWFTSPKYSPLKGQKGYQKSVAYIQRHEAEELGRALDYEILNIDSPVPESAIVYAVLKYETGAFFIKTVYYWHNGNWNLQHYKYCTNPTHIVPDSLYQSKGSNTDTPHADHE